MSDRIKVLLATEGTYPFHQGGVSTWCDLLVQQLGDVDFTIYSVLMDPFVTQKFKLPDNAELIKMPLWGTEEPSEHLSTPFSQQFLAKKRTTRKVIRDQFIPLFCELIEEIIALEKDSHRLARVMYDLYIYFQMYEYKVSFKAEDTWNTYKDIILKRYQDGNSGLARPDLYCLVQSLGWVYRFMNILNTPIPDVHVTHSSAAAFCGIPCVLAKMKNRTPYLLTEHGIYLREQYLSLGKREYSSFLNSFLMRLVHSVTAVNYTYADQVSPVCQYNTRWEEKFQVPKERIQVIYNGVDRRIFTEAPIMAHEQPTVVTIARIDPLKDIVTLIKSAAVVKAEIPDVKFIIYGSVSVPMYYEECLALREDLELTDTVIFAGHTSNMAAAYESGDVVALTSISEAFPYSVVEAMMVGKPCIATDVGGIREALGNTGVLVNPRDYEALAEGLVKLLVNPGLRQELGQEARERAMSYFSLERVLELHLKSYMKLALANDEKTVRPAAELVMLSSAERMRRQRLFAERGYAFMASGMYRDAIRHFKLAILEEPGSTASPVLMMEIANGYNQLAEYDKAFASMEKYEALVVLQIGHTA